jgi:cell wall-associated NlpC family hydrolase
MPDIALSPAKGGGRSIATFALKPADIIVSTTGHFVSKAIRFGTFSPVSHAMVYTGNDFVAEAVGDGVRETSLTIALTDASLAVAYRRNNLTDDNVKEIVRFVREKAAMKSGYDYTGLVGAGAGANGLVCVALGAVGCSIASLGGFSSSSKFFCSELVLEAFRRVNKPITSGRPDTSNPGQIPGAVSTGVLTYVGHLIA